jgi:glycosyltransferase involved in cell wall biosynthesis
LKVAVYTIALNEAAHVERWARSAIDADYRIVADTGSTDDTVERLRRAGVTVHNIAVRPWRFDDARNAVLALVPSEADVCLSMDMDEYLTPGWRPKLEAAWVAETTALWCQKAQRMTVDDPMPKTWAVKKFHSRWGYRIKRPVHEALFRVVGDEVAARCNDIIVNEVQDRTKRTRSQYLQLLELAHSEDPNDGQICFWLGREYMYANQNEHAMAKLTEYLAFASGIWSDERAEAMRYLARMQPERRAYWLDKARQEAPHRREVWHDLAELFHDAADWPNLYWACTNGIGKTRTTNSYLDDRAAWGFRLYDLGAIACWQLGLMEQAVTWGTIATEHDPCNERLKSNLHFFTSKMNRDRISLVNDFQLIKTLAEDRNSAVYIARRPDSDMLHHAHPEFELLSGAWIANNELNNSGDMSRFYSLILNVKQIVGQGIEGDFAELGVYRGNSAAVLVHFARAYQRRLFLFDTFQGFDERDLIGVDSTKDVGFSDTSLDLVKSVVGDDNVVYCKGHFPDSIPEDCRRSRFAVVHIDCDLFQPAKYALEFFYPRMSPGGLLLVHDYSGKYWHGIKGAVDEFLSNKSDNVVLMPDKSGTAIIRKSLIAVSVQSGETGDSQGGLSERVLVPHTSPPKVRLAPPDLK